ncbi:prolyl oligopeptidase family serine peptidase [Dyadobacter flavalbus]|uniref:Prolyl oligopeptidase family serine peptidase n=1 Tax=Dyadobacter flavalbus TaxID=2579942 RepID=A0A5M8QQS8_9BACT|nr:prolyl oligopeptidase family serine peptidase [Dyadobacter flavalbus]KAA6436853.1 prolyl oligopeptidase family serine peptidase [Dyadobacter flavalbus]
MKRFLLALVLLTGLGFQAYAQQDYYFKEGLGIGPCHQYGREALYKDELAYQLYNGTLSRPAEGKVLFTNEKGTEVKWRKINADSLNRFRGEAFTNGYVYLTYNSAKEQTAVLTMTGHDMAFVNGVPHAGDMYRYGWMHLPVRLKKGNNEIYARVARFGSYGGVKAQLSFPKKPVYLNIEDLTIPDIVPGLKNDSLWAGLVVVNTSSKVLKGFQIKSSVSGKETITTIPSVPAYGLRKVGVLINAADVSAPGKQDVAVTLLKDGRQIDESIMAIQSVEQGKQYSRTFISELDGSVQYYAVSPQLKPTSDKKPALFFSVHGAEVQAISQARAYKPKEWGVVVAPTNRRPRGFNWEDWGRLDALEVLEIAKKQFQPDSSRIYLTGHSMGGHGTWFLGATYPEKWAAIAPSAGYPTLSSYGSHDGVIPDSAGSPMESILLRSSNASNVLALTSNYKSLGVYVAHGDADKTVSVKYARQMRDILGKFHRDFSYYEHIGGEHWYGDISVDWPPIFDFFSWHFIPADTAVNFVDFITANPGISSKMRWAEIQQQVTPLKYSRIQISLNKKANKISGSTSNVAAISFNLGAFATGTEVQIALDSLAAVNYKVKQRNETIYLKKDSNWTVSTPEKQSKNPRRNGTFKEAFKNNMVFVYATGGSKEEADWALEKAKYDAETWYYRGNGAVELIADKDFNPEQYKNRGIVLYGNKDTNAAWNKLLRDCPVNVSSGKITISNKNFAGDNLAACFIWPRSDSENASVAVISGTGKKGFQAANANQYFSGGSGFPDLMIYSLEMLSEGIKDVKMAGFFGNDWSVEKGEFIYN